MVDARMTTYPPTLNEVELAHARCAAYSLIAHGFRDPDRSWRAELADPARWAEWPDRLADTHGPAVAPLRALRALFSGSDEATAVETLQPRFAALFGHCVRGACPPYELEFGQGEVIQRAADLADISGFYAAFGMDLSGEISERADHVSVEAEFLAVLCAKEACGLEQGDCELVEAARDAQRQFLKSHLGRWLPAFVRRLAGAAPGDYYSRLAEFADAFVTCECQRCSVSIGSALLPLRPVDPAEDASQSCGPPGECGATRDPALTQLTVSRAGTGS
ncbi:MAG: hypothetical protein C4547_07810 [Phycisphaerales bacterium]|nr:MAG: hypothetical protein C4547_07810 [Phycisphaerales bacterium]